MTLHVFYRIVEGLDLLSSEFELVVESIVEFFHLSILILSDLIDSTLEPVVNLICDNLPRGDNYALERF